MSKLQNMLNNNPMLNFENEEKFRNYFSGLFNRLNNYWGSQDTEFEENDRDIGEWVNEHKNAWRLPVNINSYYRRIIHTMASEYNIYSESSDVDDSADRLSRQIVLFKVPSNE